MLSRILWSVFVGSLIALVWVGYKRGAFDNAGDNMIAGVDRIRERLQEASNTAREGLHKARNRASEGLETLSDAAREKAMQARDRVERVTGV